MPTWLALLFGVGVWITTSFDAAMGVLALVPLALFVHFPRLQVASLFR